MVETKENAQIKCATLLSYLLTHGPVKKNLIIPCLKELYKRLEDNVPHNLIPNLLPNSKYWPRLAPFCDFGSLPRFNILSTLRGATCMAFNCPSDR